MVKKITPKRFEVKYRELPNDKIEKAVFIDGEKLDYSVDLEAYQKVSAMGAEYQAAAQQDIEKHFAECVSEFLGRKVTSEDIFNAIKTGWI